MKTEHEQGLIAALAVVQIVGKEIGSNGERIAAIAVKAMNLLHTASFAENDITNNEFDTLLAQLNMDSSN